jgi:hypothetical protein
MTDLLQLADRCEQADGQNREWAALLLRHAFEAIHGPKPPRVRGGSDELTAWLALFNPFYAMLRADAFLDAAMSLVPDGWSIGLGDLRGYDPPLWRAHLRDHNNPDASRRQWVEGNTSASAALALCAAALRARAAQ